MYNYKAASGQNENIKAYTRREKTVPRTAHVEEPLQQLFGFSRWHGARKKCVILHNLPVTIKKNYTACMDVKQNQSINLYCKTCVRLMRIVLDVVAVNRSTL